MIKVYFYIVIRKKRTNWSRFFYQKPIVRTTILLSLICPFKTDFFQGSFRYFSTKPAFAQTENKKTDTPKNHRLENFLLSTKDRDEWTRLMLAILNSVTAVESVLSQGVRVNIRGTDRFHGVTPLMFASRIGEEVIVKLLVEKGARLNDTDSLGNTALIEAAKMGYLDIVRFMLQQGANPNAKTNENWTALMFASHEGHVKVLEALLKYGANSDSQNKFGMSPVMYASQNGHIEILKKLINRDANVNLTSLNGSTALMWAIRSGHEKIAELLMESGANPHPSENEFQRSPLLLAAKFG